MILTTAFVIIISVLFVLLWLFARTIDKRIWVSGLISLVLTPVIYFYVLYPLINIFTDYHHEKYFDSEAWKGKPGLRYEMADHLETSELVINKSKNEVAQLLGKPEWFSWNDAIKANDSNFWNYNLGIKPGAFNRMQECIKITFDADKASKVEHYQLELKFDE
ncbi:hypothetical protein [Formosa sp. S-31]|uniref:hypothetical protein n=1 Tax=Formosa sp. S-31 TaxID=2790949 RepID=UPI003EBC946D